MFQYITNVLCTFFQNLDLFKTRSWATCNILYGLVAILSEYPCIYDFSDERVDLDGIKSVEETTDVVLVDEKEDTLPEKELYMDVYVRSYKDKLAMFSGYTRKYNDEPKEADWVHLLNAQLLEYTPLGNVLMYYDSSKDTFVYFSDRILPYECINTVARRYVVTYNCTKLYLDDVNPESSSCQTSVVTNLRDSPSGTMDSVNDKVFAKLKTYRTPKKETIIHTSQKINRFTYGGKLMNFLFLKKTVPTKTFKYSGFKYKKSVSTPLVST